MILGLLGLGAATLIIAFLRFARFFSDKRLSYAKSILVGRSLRFLQQGYVRVYPLLHLGYVECPPPKRKTDVRRRSMEWRC